jgi:hypothetical protein
MRWKTAHSHQATATTYGSPTYWRGRVYMGTSGPNGDQSTARGSVVALQEGSGRMRWRTYTVPPGHDGGAVWSTPAIDRATGRLYVGTGNAYHAPVAATTDSVLKMDATTGRILDHFQGTANDIFASADNPLGPDADFGASPNLIAGPGGRTLVGEGAKSGIYWALRRHTMHPAWKRPVGPGSAIGGILGSTAYDGARIYGTDAVNGKVWALGRNGSQLWSSADAGPLDFSPVAVANGVLYSVSPQGALIARDSSTGAILNQLNLAGPTFGGASVARRAIYVAVGIGPPPPPAPQSDGPGSIVAFGQTARSHPREFRLRFSKRAPRRPVGMRFHWFLHRTPDSPTTKPSPLRTEVVDLPRGARFDGSTLPACQATNAQLQQTGPSGCPASSEVGSGTAILMSGLPSDPVRANVTVFNWGNGTIEVITQRDTGATLAIDRGTFTGPNELTNHPPRGPGGPPDFQTVLSQIDLTYSKIRGRHRSGFITTPPRCPRSGRWKSRISYSTADGHGYRRTSTTPCRQLRIGN